jgi:hypothetical protein
VQLRFVTLRHVTFTLCCFTLCSNIIFCFFRSDAVGIKYEKERGRFAVAARDIAVGELIAVETAFVALLDKASRIQNNDSYQCYEENSLQSYKNGTQSLFLFIICIKIKTYIFLFYLSETGTGQFESRVYSEQLIYLLTSPYIYCTKIISLKNVKEITLCQ